MEVTTEMLHAAITEAVKQGILPKYGSLDDCGDKWKKMKLILEAALNELPNSEE